MEHMNLNDNGDGMVPLTFSGKQGNQQPTPGPMVFKPEVNLPEKNIEKQQMDSTPIADIMSGPEDQMMQQPERIMYAQQSVPQQQMMMPATKQHPFGLADDQYYALIAGVCAAIAFSKPVQEKLMGVFPQFSIDGGLSTMGLLASGLLVALLYYMGQRFILKN